MTDSGLSRSHFLALSSLFATVGATPTPALNPIVVDRRVERALVLSGGGARGAYQAGIIDSFVKSGGIADGSPLAPYGIVCGTSIGAINGYFVATGQYTALRNLWYGVARQDVIRLKHKYAEIAEPDGGVATRIAAAMRLIISLTTHDRGVIDGDHLRAWLAARINPGRRVLMPLVWTVTNLSTQSPEFFYLIDTQLSAEQRERATTAIRIVVGANAVLREATPDLLIDALRASAAIPVAFDPIELPTANGSGRDLYVDGGVTANTPIGVARAAARNVDVVLMDPPFEREEYKNAFEIGYGVFGAMQRRILESDLRSAYLEAFGKRSAAGHALSPQFATFVSNLYDANFFVIQPQKELPVDVVGFDQSERLWETYQLGFNAAHAGFAAYEYS
jgi:predicted acylesterase/phospholipase RssA